MIEINILGLSLETPELMTPPALRTEDLAYDLPEDRIATRPAEPRDSARMLVISRSSDTLEHRKVSDLPDYLVPGDALVMNKTAVIPARFVGKRTDSGGKVEGLFLDEPEVGTWRVMLKSNGRLRPGLVIELADGQDRPSGQVIRLGKRDGDEWIVHPESNLSAREILGAVGRTPLPPYILRARGVRGDRSVDDAQDRSWYQTVYADPDQGRSVAAPTAGLHFTPELLQTLLGKGVERLEISLDVGPGTFKPITTPTLEMHDMYWECYEVPPETLESLNAIQDRKKAGESGRLFAVGTTSVRTLESLPDPLPVHESLTGTTDLFIAPPYDFRFVDGLLTNFHLPRSTLLALVAALVGLERLLAVYEQAIREGYRFYSYGDAMLILP